MLPIAAEMQELANPEKAEIFKRFFKTGEGQYGHGDVFLGLTVPETRKIASKYKGMDFGQLEELLKSKFHEHRLAALEILVMKYEQGSEEQKKKCFEFYMKNTKRINNWDLVDLSASYVVGDYLFGKSKGILHELAKSENIWERRIAIIATFDFIRKGKYDETFKIAEILMQDEHDLIHKAAGWMLREIGKRDQKAEEKFLDRHCRHMPRTMLRYAIERLPEAKRRKYMQK